MTDESAGTRGPGKARRSNLRVLVRRGGLMGRMRAPVTATWMDFHPGGMAFEAALDAGVGDALRLDLSVEDVEAKGVVAVVRERRAASSGITRYDVDFDFEADAHMRTGGVRERMVVIHHALKEITPHLLKDSLLEVSPIDRPGRKT